MADPPEPGEVVTAEQLAAHARALELEKTEMAAQQAARIKELMLAEAARNDMVAFSLSDADMMDAQEELNREDSANFASLFTEVVSALVAFGDTREIKNLAARAQATSVKADVQACPDQQGREALRLSIVHRFFLRKGFVDHRTPPSSV